MPQMARKPYTEPPWASPGHGVKSPIRADFGHQSAPPAVVKHYLRLWVYRLRAALSFIGAACDFLQLYWPAYSCSPHPRHRPTAACSSLKTRPTVTASTSASPTAKNA